MPRATVSIKPERYDLKTVEGGYVELKRLPYGDWLKRNELAMQVSMIATKGKDPEASIGLMQQKVTEFEFSNCIVDHNLDDDNDQKLDFKSPVALKLLDPKVGSEIATYIAELHEFDLGN